MISPRTTVYAPDRSIGRSLGNSLTAVGSVVSVATEASEVNPHCELMLACSNAETSLNLLSVLGQLPLSSVAAVVFQNPNLQSILNGLRQPNVHAVIAQEYVSDQLATYVGAKLLWGNIFGLAKVMPWGVKIYNAVVGSNEERAEAIAMVSQFAKTVRVRSKCRESIELVLDELLMNALYNAPVDAQGHALFAEVSPKDRGGVRIERPTILQFACDGSRFAVSVRDGFGSLSREGVMNHLLRCLTSSDQIERKTSGAGLGLYLVANHVTELIFNVLPGIATEVICIFDLQAQGQQLRHMGFYQEMATTTSDVFADSSSSSGGKVAPTSLTKEHGKVGSAGTAMLPKLIPATLATAVVILVIATMLLAWPYLKTPTKGELTVVTDPPDAVVYIDGVRRGQANPELKLTDLTVQTAHAVTVKKDGYQEIRDVVVLNADNPSTLRLTLPVLRGRLRVTSVPAGAEIWIDGRATGQRTPALLEDLEPNRKYQLRLVSYGYAPDEAIVTMLSDRVTQYQGQLATAADYASLTLDSLPSNARLLMNEVDSGQVTPINAYVVRANQPYRLQLVAAGRVPWELLWQPQPGERLQRVVNLLEGSMVTLSATATTKATVTYDGESVSKRLPVKDWLVPIGVRTFHIQSDKPYLNYEFKMEVRRGEPVTRKLQFGFVEPPSGGKIDIDSKLIDGLVTLLAGQHDVTVVTSNGQRKTQRVVIVANQTTKL